MISPNTKCRNLQDLCCQAVLLSLFCSAPFLLDCHEAYAVDGKRGWAGGQPDMADAANANWYYNWWHTKPSGDAGANADWIPLVKYTNNLSTKLDLITGYGDVDTILVLNEPERVDQSNVSVSEAISIWPQFEATGMNLITPAISDNAEGQSWISSFMSQANANNYQMDGFAFHWYGASTPNATGAANNFLSRVDHYWNTYGLPLWITEFAIHDWAGNYTDQQILDANAQFLDIVIPALESRSYVEAYSFYHWFSDATLLEQTNGLWTPTNVGDAYIPSYRTGETLNLNGLDQGEDRVYVRGGSVTNTGATINNAVKYLYAVDGVSSLSGSGDWGLEASGWAEINVGATLEKTGSNTVRFQGTPINNRGTLKISSGILSLETGVSLIGAGTTDVHSGGLVSLGVATDRLGISISQPVNLRGGTIQANSITDGSHVVSAPMTVHNTSTFSGDGNLFVNAPINAPGGGGGGGLVKNGSGSLFLNASNGYQGDTVINEGTIQIGSSASLTETPTISVKPQGVFHVASLPSGLTLDGQTLLLEGQVTGSIQATNGSTVSTLKSTAVWQGNLTNSNSHVSVGGLGFNETGPSTPIVSTGLNLNFEAAQDLSGDLSWIDTVSGQSLSFASAASTTAISNPAYPGIGAAYHIPTSDGATGLNNYFENSGPRSLQDATFEVWFNVSTTAGGGDQVLFEAGGTDLGISFQLDNSALSFNVNGVGAGSTTFSLDQTVGTGWHQAVGIINLEAAGDSITLYVDNALVGTVNSLTIDDWSGGNLTGIGKVAGVLGAGGTPVPYHDKIALVRYYQNFVFDADDVSQNFTAITTSGSTLPTNMQIDGDYTQLSDGTIEFDLLTTSMHDSLSLTGSATLAGNLNVSEIAGFSPEAGDTFTILSALGGLNGQFNTVNLPALSGLQWLVEYGATQVDLSVIFGADFDQSGVVDGRDFFAWQRGFGLTGQLNNANGDADGNGVVDGDDLEIWQAQYGTSPGFILSAVSTVPEPSTLVTALAILFGHLYKRRRYL